MYTERHKDNFNVQYQTKVHKNKLFTKYGETYKLSCLVSS